MNKQNQKLLSPRAVADVEIGIILAAMDIEAPPQTVFNALSDPKEIEHWWGDEHVYRMTEWKADFKVGGKYTVIVVRPDGSVFPASGKFLQIDAAHRLSHTRVYEWDNPSLGRQETTITYNFYPMGERTRLTVRHEGFIGYDAAAYEHAEGWERVFGWLGTYLKNKTL